MVGQTQPTSSSPSRYQIQRLIFGGASWLAGSLRKMTAWASQMFEVVAPIDHLDWMFVINLFSCEENPGAPRWTQMPRKSTDSQKRFLIGAFAWIRISGFWYCWRKMLFDFRHCGQTFFFFQGGWYSLQNCFFVGILCFSLSMTKMFRFQVAVSKNVARRKHKTCCSMVNPAE